MTTKKEFLAEALGENPFDNLGLGADVLKGVMDTAGIEAVRAMTDGMGRLVQTTLHPDRVGTDNSSPTYDKVVDAARDIASLPNDSFTSLYTAFISKKRRQAPNNNTQVYIDNPEHLELLDKAHAKLVSGRVVFERLVRPSYITIDARAGKSPIETYYHPGGSKSLVLRAHNERRRISKPLSTEVGSLAQEPWWAETHEYTRLSNRLSTNSRGAYHTELREVYIDSTTGRQQAFDRKTGAAINASFPDWFSNILGENLTMHVALSREIEDHLGEELRIIKARAYPSYLARTRFLKGQQTGQRLVGAWSEEHVTKAVKSILSSTSIGYVDEKSAAIAYDAMPLAQRHIKARAAEYYLNQKPSHLLHEVDDNFIEGSQAVGVDEESGKLVVLGRIISMHDDAESA